MELAQNEEEREKEDIWTKSMGELGKWQVMILLVVLWPIKISAAWQQLGIIFIAPNTTFVCMSTNLTKTPEASKCYDDCVMYEYHTEFRNTIISQWELICERSWMANFTQTMAMFGVLLGSILFGFLSDRYGRRPALLTATILQLCTSMTEAFCPTYWTFTTVRFFVGISSAGTMLCAFTLIIEITGSKKRELINCLTGIPISFGEMIMPIFAYFLRTYDKFCLGVAVPNLIYLIYFFILPESPKWLISMGRLEEASVVMKRGAEWNNLPSTNMIIIVKSMSTENLDSNNTKQEKATYFDLVKSTTLRIYTICSCIIWFASGVIFYGCNQYIGQTSSNVFVSVSVAGALQIPGILLAGVLCKYWGRRITLISFFSVCALGNGLTAVPYDWFYFKTILKIFALSCASGAFSSVYLYTSELFPTVVRNMALGASSTVSRVGSMLAPFVSGLIDVAPWSPPVIFAIVPLVAAITCYFLPETRGNKLKDHLT